MEINAEFEKGPDPHRDSILNDLFDDLIKSHGSDSKIISCPVNAILDIGVSHELADITSPETVTSRLRGVAYEKIGFVPYKGNSGNDSENNYLVFSVGRFHPFSQPYERSGVHYLEKFDNFSNFFAAELTQRQFKRFTSVNFTNLPKDGVGIWGEKNPYEFIIDVAKDYRSSVPHDRIFKVDNLEASVIICDGEGILYHLPEDFEDRRKLNLEIGISKIKAFSVSKGRIDVQNRSLLLSFLQEDLMVKHRFLQPMPLDQISLRTDVGGEGPKGYSGSLLREGVAVRPGTGSRPDMRLRF